MGWGRKGDEVIELFGMDVCVYNPRYVIWLSLIFHVRLELRFIPFSEEGGRGRQNFFLFFFFSSDYWEVHVDFHARYLFMVTIFYFSKFSGKKNNNTFLQKKKIH
jgi:hypothetical protein